MSADALLSLCVVALPAVVLFSLWAYTLGTHRGRPQSVRRQNNVMTLREGETFVGVIERSQGQYIFLVHDATDSTNDE